MPHPERGSHGCHGNHGSSHQGLLQIKVVPLYGVKTAHDSSIWTVPVILLEQIQVDPGRLIEDKKGKYIGEDAATDNTSCLSSVLCPIPPPSCPLNPLPIPYLLCIQTSARAFQTPKGMWQ